MKRKKILVTGGAGFVGSHLCERLSKDQNNDVNYDDYKAVVLAVAHDKFKDVKLNNKNQVVYDIKSILDYSDGKL